LLESLALLDRTVFLFRTKCVDTLTPNIERCKANLEASTYFAAAYAPILGYDTVSRVIAGYSSAEAAEILKNLAVTGH
jgi:aspartate ammonia-lyase